MKTLPPDVLLDTSVFIAIESGRPIDLAALPDHGAVSPVTIAELQAGVLLAGDIDTRARRLGTLGMVADITLLPVTAEVAAHWARLRVHLREAGRRINVNDLWIAATAAAHGLPLATQDADFEPLDGVAGIEIIRV